MTPQKIVKLALMALIPIIVIGFFYFDGHLYLSFGSLKENQLVLKEWTRNNLAAAIIGFFTIYLFSTALSLPGAVALTLASGLLFGLGLGTLIASFASTMGATLAFLTSRYLLRDWVYKRLNSHIERINKDFNNNGAYYLFTLRLMPIVPFFILNLAMGLTPIRTWTYYWISQLAMLPATFIIVNAGTKLSEIDSTQKILSPEILISLVLLGVFPLIVKKLISKFTGEHKL